MTKEYCDECSLEIDLYYEDSEVCSTCKEVHYCTYCSDSLKKYLPFILMCQICQEDYDEAMYEYPESVESEAIGDRYGDYDQYDNMGEEW